MRGTWISAALALTLATGAAAAQEASELVGTCSGCHGADGVSQMPGTPSLAGQPADYTIVQLFMFRQEMRGDSVMNAIAADLSDEDIRALAAHFAELAPPPAAEGKPDAARMERGQELSRVHRCGTCHRPDYSGRDQVPALAGQREEYLATALRAYKSGERPGYEPLMNEVAQELEDEEIDALAYYLAHRTAREGDGEGQSSD